MKKVITYGTFDLFHQGHYNIIKRARDLGDYLIVGVTSESYDIERGKLNVQDSLMTRIENVRDTGLADEIIIEEYQGQKVHDIVKHNVDVFVVGSDWIGKFDYLKEYCEVRYLERTRHISSTKLREQKRIYHVGVITDRPEDKGIVLESKYISGISVEKVYAEEAALSEEFCRKYELGASTADLESFFDGIDIIFLNVSYEKRERYAKEALAHGKYLICTPPVSSHPDTMMGYIQKASESQVLIIDNIITGYLRAFTQLIWLLRGGLIGDIVHIHCAISQKQFKQSDDLNDILLYPLLLCLRILGMDCKDMLKNQVTDSGGKVVYEKIFLQYQNALADIEISSLGEMKSSATILGTNGRVEIPEDWWNMGYFEVYDNDSSEKKRYSYNFEGNGLRYLLQEALIMIQDKRRSTTRIFSDEIIKMAQILSKLEEE